MDRRFYQNVSGSSTAVDQYVIPANKQFKIIELGGNAVGDPSVSVRIIYDYGEENRVLFSTSGDMRQEPQDMVFHSSSEKILAIVLDNDLLISKYIGAYWISK